MEMSAVTAWNMICVQETCYDQVIKIKEIILQSCGASWVSYKVCAGGFTGKDYSYKICKIMLKQEILLHVCHKSLSNSDTVKAFEAK